MGNKGACGASLSFVDCSSVAFVSCHLAARPERVKQRNDDYRAICRGLNLGGDRNLGLPDQFDHVFWLGDLNYRIDRCVAAVRRVLRFQWRL